MTWGALILSFFLGWRIPDSITRPSGWCASDLSRRSQRTVPDRSFIHGVFFQNSHILEEWFNNLMMTIAFMTTLGEIMQQLRWELSRLVGKVYCPSLQSQTFCFFLFWNPNLIDVGCANIVSLVLNIQINQLAPKTVGWKITSYLWCGPGHFRGF